MKEIFWKDYFEALGQAIGRLSEVIRDSDIDTNDYMQDASIQRFEFVIKLFWKSMKKILSYEKLEAITPRDVISQSYQYGLIDDEKIWLNMLDDRNNTLLIYKHEDARSVFENIRIYLPLFEKSYSKLKTKYKL